jgi:two-component sensor histidine kinase
MTVIGYDITERKQAEEQIKSLLAEKELLLKEVHHRVKNNMFMIMSLLSLQASTLKDSGAISSLQDAKSRVQSMMVLYDKLSNTAGSSIISTQEYLTSLVNEIINNFPNRGQVVLEAQIDDFHANAKIALPIGIIINELLTNIMKHAFIGRKEGLIRVLFSINPNHALEPLKRWCS